MADEKLEIGDEAASALAVGPRLRVGPGTNVPLRLRTSAVEEYETTHGDALGSPRELTPGAAVATPRAVTAVRFTNSTGRSISVAYGRARHECQAECGDPWEVLGWINLASGQSADRANPTGTRWYYYFAQDGSGTKWDGNFPAQVVQRAFARCWCIGSTDSFTVGMDEVDLAAFPGGVEFTP